MAGADSEQKEVIRLPEEISKHAPDAVLPNEVKGKIESLPFDQSNKNLSLAIGMKEKIEVLRARHDPVNILVIGRSGVGKSTLINAMFGKDVVKVKHGINSDTSKVRAYLGEFKGVTINIYDSPGFRDNKGRREYDILLDIAKHGLFDLILICTKLEDKDNQFCNFSELASYLHEDMWKRTVVVLTFANIFIQLKSVKKSSDLKVRINEQIDSHKVHFGSSLSKHGIKKEVMEKIPFCLAGLEGEKLPTTDDWLSTLWGKCIDHSSDETRHFLSFYARHRRIIEAGSFIGSVGAGAGIGAIVGSVVPGPGTALGAGIGAGVGGVVGAFVGRIFK